MILVKPRSPRPSPASAASLSEWDIIGIGSRDVILVQVKTRDWPGSVEMETLREFAAPPMARKLVHRWRDRQRLPDVRELWPQPARQTETAAPPPVAGYRCSGGPSSIRYTSAALMAAWGRCASRLLAALRFR